MKHLLTLLAFLSIISAARAQDVQPTKVEVWFPFQLIPNLTLYSSSPCSGFGFEWEATPLLYSFGINKQVSPWYSFIVDPTARFAGSIELTAAAQVFTTKLGNSYFAYSGHLMAYVPLIEWGEKLTLNLGAGVYHVADRSRVFKVAGISTLLGFVHFNIKHSPNPTTWIGSLEFRVF
ncbi:MAG: hypothetical protein FJ217_06365 [Ignavibacteria bacterium]|nr:hypothetical protein [Ignavibacteria bacterium]